MAFASRMRVPIVNWKWLFRLWTRQVWFGLLPRGVRASDVSAILMSIGVTFVLFAVLYAFNEREVDDWALPLTLNAFVSLLVAVLYMLITWTLAVSLSQMKWNHYTSTAHPLYDFKIIDDASRGSLGSLRLLHQGPRKLTAILAALLTISIQAIGPLVQQVITIDIQTSTGSDTATLPAVQTHFEWPGLSDQNFTSPLGSLIDQIGRRYITTRTPIPAGIESPEFVAPKQSVVAAVTTGLLSDQMLHFPIEDVCSSAECYWPPYISLSFKHNCTDISDQLIVPGDVNDAWESFAQKFPDTLQSSNQVPKDLLASAPMFRLPNGYEISFFKMFLDHWLTDGSNLSVYCDPPQLRRYDRLDPLHNIDLCNTANWTPLGSDTRYKNSIYISSLHNPVKAQIRTGTLLLTQMLYLETSFIKGRWNLGQLTATECTIDLVAHRYQSRISNGQLFEEPIGDTVFSEPVEASSIATRSLTVSTGLIQKPAYRIYFNPSNANPASFVVNTTFFRGRTRRARKRTALSAASFSEPRISINGTRFGIDPWGFFGTSNVLQRLLTGNDTNVGWHDWPADDLNAFATQMSFDSPSIPQLMRRAFLSDLVLNDSAKLTRLSPSDIINNTAQSLTNLLRSDSQSQVLINGTNSVMSAVYLVRWPWFSIPIAFVVLATATAATIMVDTSRKAAPMRNDSTIETMIFGLANSPESSKFYSQCQTQELHRMARTTSVRLGGKFRALEVVQQTDLELNSGQGHDADQDVVC